MKECRRENEREQEEEGRGGGEEVEGRRMDG